MIVFTIFIFCCAYYTIDKIRYAIVKFKIFEKVLQHMVDISFYRQNMLIL